MERQYYVRCIRHSASDSAVSEPPTRCVARRWQELAPTCQETSWNYVRWLINEHRSLYHTMLIPLQKKVSVYRTVILQQSAFWTIYLYVRFQVLTAASTKLRFVFWDVLQCKIIVNRRFRGMCCLHHHPALMMAAARTSETSVNNYFTRQYIPEDKSEHFSLVHIFVAFWNRV
jgi:hypothetical protein